MPEAYFVKVYKNMNWSNILSEVQEQKKSSRMRLKYCLIAEISLDKIEFDSLANSIATPSPSYESWASKSKPDEHGVWNCISIKCLSDERNIIVYTSGRTIPLYVSTNVDE